MKVVLDASVVLKWLLADEATEPDTEQALEILQQLREGTISAVQPAHWLVEVAAVLARKAPDQAEEGIDLLTALELPEVRDNDLLKEAALLSQQLTHHLFDTLYHALALRIGAVLVTADGPYYRKAIARGGIVHLTRWPPPGLAARVGEESR